jgi:probable rRNA maturation factor
MILIKNNVRKIKVNEKKLTANVQAMLDSLGYSDFDIGIWLTTDATIRRYNLDFRKKDKATDILSFPYHTTLKPSQKIKPSCPEDKNLGDIIISLEYVARKAKEYERSFEEHFVTLLAHGMAHLLGHDHIKDDEFETMQKLENKLLHYIFSDK